MSNFIASLVILMLVFLFMAIGYIVKGKTITGSCGGLSAMGIKKECDCEEPCEKRKEIMRKEEKEK